VSQFKSTFSLINIFINKVLNKIIVLIILKMSKKTFSFPCDLCESGANSEKAFILHMKRFHNVDVSKGRKPIIFCSKEDCDSSFGTMDDLIKHLKLQHDEPCTVQYQQFSNETGI
jgi:hypothetical protein